MVHGFLAGLGVSLKVLDPFISPIIVAVSVITTFTTPYFIRLANPFAEWLYKILPTKVQETLDRYASGNDESKLSNLCQAESGFDRSV